MTSDSQTAAAALTFDRHPPDYLPGETLRVEAAQEALANAQTIELSLVWHTAGKGDEDLFVHDFRRLSAAEIATGEPVALEAVLPASPLSYPGRTVKVCWCARLRLFLPGGKQQLIEAPFRLGAVAAADATNQTSPEEEDA